MGQMSTIGQGAALSKKARRKAKRFNGGTAAKPTILSAPWDRGADGPANQINLKTEPATDIDPETGRETPNPNGIKRRRRQGWPERYGAAKKLTVDQVRVAKRLRDASDGHQDRDPLAALAATRSTGDFDPLAAYVDNRALFREMWADIPKHCRPVVERVVIDDLPIWHGNAMVRERHMMRLQEGLNAIA